MYTVVDLKLPDGIGLKINDNMMSSSFFSNRLGQSSELSRRLVVNCQGVEWNKIPVFDYVVGEEIRLQRSVFGVRLSKGSPDYSGTTKRINLTRIDKILEDRKRDERIWRSSNLCEEILLPSGTHLIGGERGDEDRNRLWREIVAAADQASSRRLFEGTVRETRPRQYYYRPTIVNMPTAWDFDGDSFRSTSRPAEEPGPEPRYVDNGTEIAPLALNALAQAAAEITSGERGTPPASRGPRPRNQRW